jgi:hypothetical protein
LHALLDIHSTSQAAPPFFVYAHTPANQALASGIGIPGIQLVMPGGLQTGTPLIEYAQFSTARQTASPNGGAVVVECGQHFLASAGVLATQVSLAFMVQTGVMSRERAAEWCVQLTGTDAITPTRAAPRRFQLLTTHVIRTPELKFTRPLIGMETFAEGELIGTDGDFEIRSPCEGCAVFMPLGAGRPAVPGREGVYLTRPLI